MTNYTTKNINLMSVSKKEFKNFDFGECFEFDGCLYIKTNSEYALALSLNGRELCRFYPCNTVNVIDADITINWKYVYE